jgi:hypothetical protein
LANCSPYQSGLTCVLLLPCRYLKVIPNETVSVYSKGSNKPEEVKKPLARSVELVEVDLKVSECRVLVEK